MTIERKANLLSGRIVVDTMPLNLDSRAIRFFIFFWKGILSAALILNFVGDAVADVRESNITDKPGGAGQLSLSCVPKDAKFTFYSREESATPLFEDRADLRHFPAGFSVRTLEQGNFSFSVGSLIWNGERQILKGTLIDGRGWTLTGVFFVFPENWDCHLHIDSGK